MASGKRCQRPGASLVVTLKERDTKAILIIILFLGWVTALLACQFSFRCQSCPIETVRSVHAGSAKGRQVLAGCRVVPLRDPEAEMKGRVLISLYKTYRKISGHTRTVRLPDAVPSLVPSAVEVAVPVRRRKPAIRAS